MSKRNNKAFTLIELIGVLVIMAIIALIAIPLVMNIIRKARVSADKRSIDAYGRSIELAIAGYLLDTGKFPTEVSQLTIEYSGNQVVCETTQINPDSSVYLTGCSVDGRNAGDYSYGSDKSPTYNAYKVGDQVSYNNINYYVIKDSGTKDSTVTLLKSEPLSVEEVNTYGVGHVNRNTSSSVGTASSSSDGYGWIAYYSGEDCGYNPYSMTQCTTDYEKSDIKYVINNWATYNVNLKDTVIDSTGQSIRLINDFDLENIGYVKNGDSYSKTSNVQEFVYNVNSWTWTMISYNQEQYVLNISSDGEIKKDEVSNYCSVVRPVIVLYKSAIQS